MTLRLKQYEEKDFIRIRDFIRDSFQKLGRANSWNIDRWEFVYYLAETRTGNLPNWLKEIGVWEDENNQIVAVACADDDAFFLLDTLEPSVELINEMIHYAETHMVREKEGTKEICISVPDGNNRLESAVRSKGYTCKDWHETVMSIDLDQDFLVDVPSGFTLKSGLEVADEQKALGHIMAFDYLGTTAADQNMAHYGNIKNAPDYRPDLDLYITSQDGEVAAFCTLWYDSVNQIANFEPVGTHKNYRKMGLGKAVMYEGLNRLKALGATKAFVGPIQPFYEKIGFSTVLKTYKWFKTLC